MLDGGTAIREVYGIEATLYVGDPPDLKKLDKQFEKTGIPDVLFCTYENIQKLVDRNPR